MIYNFQILQMHTFYMQKMNNPYKLLYTAKLN